VARIEKTITINAPVEKVFDYVDDPTNLPEIWPSLIDVMDVERLPAGGTKFRWRYKMAGVRTEGTTEAVEYVANQRIVSKSEGGISSTITWDFAPEDGGTKVTNAVDYAVHVPVLRKLAESFLVRVNENEGEMILANLKARMEA
jgi:uncharacterized protein YndB with AHSA1/START domain